MHAIGLLLAAAIELTAGNAEIVIDRQARAATRFAAQELKTFLDQSLGADVKVVDSPTDGKRQIVLGDCELSRAAGVDLAGKPRDTFVVRAQGGRVYISGGDSNADVAGLIAAGRPTDMRSLMQAERATAFGVYEFLERFAGCRFYFPGEMGTVVPRKASVVVPDGTCIERSPRFTERHVSMNGGVPLSTQMLNWVRLRLETGHLQCGHGLNAFDYARRFADTHPEYFCLRADGKRATLKVDPNPKSQSHPVGQLCHTSAVWDEIAEDVLSYFRGESAERRLGAGRSWGKNCRGDHVDIMPQDGMWKCHCANCLAAYDSGSDYANTLIWRRTADVARRITAAGLKGRVCQMAYSPHAEVPAFDLPENVDVMVATAGPWSLASGEFHKKSARVVLDWSGKLGHTVWLWTYPGKVNAMDLPAVPQVAPRAWGEYYKRMAPYIFGAMNESESDSFYFNYLNYYVFSRVAWDASADVDGIIAEHHRLMYGGGASDMAKFFARLEEIWMHEVVREDSATSTGGEPSYAPPGSYDLLVNVYSREVLHELRGHLDAAAAAAGGSSVEARRVRFAAERLLGPIYKRARTLQKALDPDEEAVRRAAAVSVQNVAATAKWWSSGMKFSAQGDALVIDAKPGGKVEIGLGAAGVSLKPGARYRVSCFIDADLCDLPFIRRKKGDGFLFELSEGKSRKNLHRVTGICGDRPRETFGFEFTAAAEPESGGSIAFRAYGVSGRVKVDGIAVMELPPESGLKQEKQQGKECIK